MAYMANTPRGVFGTHALELEVRWIWVAVLAGE
jgi:hypothetical protein